MNPQLRIIRILGGLVAGVGAAVIIMVVGEAISHRLVPPPAGPDIYAAADPRGPATGTLLGLIAGWFLAGIAGGALAARIARETWAAWVVAAVILVSELYLFAQVRHPVWTIALGILAPIAGAWLGARLARLARA